MTILYYHSVDPVWRSPLAVTPEAFAHHMRWLAKHKSVIDLADAVRQIDGTGRMAREAVALTFDDGFSGVYEHAFPVLRRLALPATVFLVTGTLTPEGRKVDWVDTPPPHPLGTLTRDEILEMQAAGIRFESHSHFHSDLVALHQEDCENDLRTSREVLEALLGTAVAFLSYPRSRHNEGVREAAMRAGFTHAFAGEREAPKRLEFAGPPYAIPRVGVYPGNGSRALRMKSTRWYLPLRESGLYPLVRRLAGRGPLSHRRAG